ncbi:MAG TPA: adenylate/guanylate cyclase domain-containing protein [Blastocatellia bacterium]|jgi:adenylate cyclase|nr:adenylate/guanylate cyclase domain-containing protein [Blastocatellia bacterium]
MPPRLIIKNAATGESSIFELARTETRIGRSLSINEITLGDTQVSRAHAIVRWSGSTCRLIDLKSANGTFVNGERIDECALSDGDTIAIGAYTLDFEEHPDGIDIQFDDKQIGKNFLLRSPAHITYDTSSRMEGQSLSALSREEIADLQKKAEILSRLYELSRLLSSVFSLGDIFKKVSEMIFRTTAADRFIVLLKEEEGEELSPFATEFRDGARINERFSISRTVLDRVLSGRVSLLSIDAQTDERFERSASLAAQRVQSVMCAPLIGQSGVLGVIYVDCQRKMKLFSADDLDMLNALAAQTSMAVENATTHDQLLREAIARAAYGRFMPQHVVEQILENPGDLVLGGKNQVVTILFSDIRDFTSMAEGLPPEVVVQLLNEYFAAMTPIIFEHQGMLDKYIGDGIMALFGVPYTDEKAAANAVAAAVAMQRRLSEFNEGLVKEGLPRISVGIGINTGTVTVGYIGSEQRTDYTVIGDHVNLAARLEKLAEPSQIIIARSTLAASGDAFPVAPFGHIMVKGKSVPVEAYRVVYS